MIKTIFLSEFLTIHQEQHREYDFKKNPSSLKWLLPLENPFYTLLNSAYYTSIKD